MTESQQNPDKPGKSEEKRSKLSVFSSKKRSNKFFIISGLFFVSACLYILIFIYGEPTIDTDYLAQLNQLNKPANYKEEDNAWPLYQKAIELYVSTYTAGDVNGTIFSTPMKKYADLNEHEQTLVLNWIEQNQAAWQELEKAIQKPFCYIKYSIQKKVEDDRDPFFGYAPELKATTLHIDYQYLSKLRRLAFLGKKRIEIDIDKGNIDNAIKDSLILLTIKLHWQQDKLLTEEIIGTVFNSCGNEGLLKIISKHELLSNKIEDIQNQLIKIYNLNSYSFDLVSDKILFLDFVQSMFTKGGLGGGHVVPKYLATLAPMTFSGSILSGGASIKQTFQEKIQYVALSLFHARRNATISKYNHRYAQIQIIQKMTPYEIKQSNIQLDIPHANLWKYKINLRTFPKESRYLIIDLLMPYTQILEELIHKNKTLFEATITILALKRYNLDKSNYPETLDELLKEGYITSIPMDPYSDKPLVYKKTDTNFTLYSVGADFKDDGGVSSLSNSGSVIKWGNSYDKKPGDAVFWPIQ
jgi:hypothetical protein